MSEGPPSGRAVIPERVEETPDLQGAHPRLSEAQIAALAALGHRRATRPGEILFRQGQRDCDFFIVLAGNVAVVDGNGTPEKRVGALPSGWQLPSVRARSRSGSPSSGPGQPSRSAPGEEDRDASDELCEVRAVLPGRGRRPRRPGRRQALPRLRQRRAIRPAADGPGRREANARDIIEPWDLPITRGLQESIHAYERLEEQIELRAILEDLAARPPLDAALSEETENRLPLIFGGVSTALARTFKLVDVELKSVHTREWERTFSLFRLLI